MAGADPTVTAGAPLPPGIAEPEWVEPTPELRELAREYGVATEYWDQGGTHHRVGGEVLHAVLEALGVDATSPDAVWKALYERRNQQWQRMLPPVFVMRAGVENQIWVHLPHGQEVSAWVDLEMGGDAWFLEHVDRWVEPRHVEGRLMGEATMHLPADLPLGWHRLWARTESPTGEVTESSTVLIVTPQRLEAAGLQGSRQWGYMSQVYAMRSVRSWGMGDLADLAELAGWSGGRQGADFILVNPLHAAFPVPPMEPSPYLPVTRRFANPIYLRVEAIEEFGALSAEDRAHIEELSEPLRLASLSSDLIDRDVIWAAKQEALKIVYQAPRSMGRQALFEAFVRREGRGLADFGVWCALIEENGGTLPKEVQDPTSPALDEARVRLADRIQWHSWLQWQLDDQMSRAQLAALNAGMRTGIVHDLAVGVHPEGSDAWSLRDVLAPGVGVGAPPDMYNQMGQNWSQPPWRPDSLAEAAFIPYRDMLRTILRNAGGVRVDHVLGLFRLWWVPDGMPAYCGTYVASDHEALVGILILEAARAGAWVVGEDLGTVEEWVRDYLIERGLLGTSILWFERDYDQEPDVPLEPEMWREHAFASVTVHDLPPTAGYLIGEHVRIRAELGLLSRAAEEELAESDAQIASWRELCVRRGYLAEDGSTEDLIVALHRVVAESPSQLVGVALTDITGDRRAQNQPGTDKEYPNWQVPLTNGDGRAVLMEEFEAQPLTPRIVEAMHPVTSTQRPAV
jgi:4-alpha-glucanotransferase